MLCGWVAILIPPVISSLNLVSVYSICVFASVLSFAEVAQILLEHIPTERLGVVDFQEAYDGTYWILSEIIG